MRTSNARPGFKPELKGFTLIELIVVIAIMVSMMALAANMMRGGGKGQGLQTAVEMVDGMVQEARLSAMGKGTWSRLIVISTPNDQARNMRSMGILTRHPKTGKWSLENRLQTLPAGFYVSPTYSTALETAAVPDKSDSKSKMKGGKKAAKKTGFGSADGQDAGKLPGYKDLVEYYFIEFDEEGRMSQPKEATRLVVVAGSAGDGTGERPTPMANGKPGMAGGVVVYPKGNVSRLRTDEQVIPN